MGGYGALRIGMKHPDVFGALYVMSPCCLSQRPPPDPNSAQEKAFEAAVAAMKSPADAASLTFFQRIPLADAAAWSPDPKNPPLYLDLPIKDGVVQPDVLAKWTANSPLVFVDQYIGNLRQYRAISLDVGDQDPLRTNTTKMHDILDSYGIANGFEVYHGTHTSHVAYRIQNHVLPFFSQNLLPIPRQFNMRRSRTAPVRQRTTTGKLQAKDLIIRAKTICETRHFISPRSPARTSWNSDSLMASSAQKSSFVGKTNRSTQ